MSLVHVVARRHRRKLLPQHQCLLRVALDVHRAKILNIAQREDLARDLEYQRAGVKGKFQRHLLEAAAVRLQGIEGQQWGHVWKTLPESAGQMSVTLPQF